MNQKLGFVVQICAASLVLSAMLFGISNSSATAVQPGEPEAAMIVSTLENESKFSITDVRLLAYVPMGKENGLALFDTVLHTSIGTVSLAQHGCNYPLNE